MIILGINYFFHDSSACIVRNGELVVAIEEERLTRVKHTNSFPEKSIQKCLEVAGVAPQDVDHIAVSIQPSKHWGRKVVYGLRLGRDMTPFLKHEGKGTYVKQRTFSGWLAGFGSRSKIHQVEHHLSHIAGSYFVSPYDKAALLSMDGSGEWSTLFMGAAEGRNITKISETMFPHSLGSFYEAATEFCGFRPNYDEGKVMGLAPFGDPTRFYNQISDMVRVHPDGRVEIDLSYFRYQNWGKRRCSDKFHQTFGRPRGRFDAFEAHHNDVAAAFQKVLEDKVLELVRILEQKTDAEYLVLAGGVSLNSVMNGRILRESRFKDLYIMPAAGDNGTSIGAAYYVHNHVLGQETRFYHSNPYVGNGYTDAEIEAVLKECKLPYRKAENLCREAAQLLREGKILGWFQGRMEIGPRALGNRSILADPTLPGMKDRINAEVKHREAYRPFAPSAPAECRQELFDIEVEAPFMLKVCYVRPEKRETIPAITHVDGTARLQTVRQETNPCYHELLTEFGKLSGVPVVLNTSFNIMGEPIVESPIDAIRCFFSTGLDALVLHDYIIDKSGQEMSDLT